METKPLRQQLDVALWAAREITEELDANRESQTDDFWISALREHVQWMLDAERWWIAVGVAGKPTRKLLGPFESRELALKVRTYIEFMNAPQTYWVALEDEIPAETLREQ